MMGTILVIVLASLLFGCRREPGNNVVVKKSISNKPEANIGADELGFETKDEFVSSEGPMTYKATMLVKGKKVIDTISEDIGYHVVGEDSVAYSKMKVKVDTLWNDSKDTVIEKYVSIEEVGIFLYAKGSKENISSKMPYFSDFSSPALIEKDVVYWGLKEKPAYIYSLYACRYKILEERTDTTYLFDKGLGTDNTRYFAFPKKIEGKYIFDSPDTSEIVLVATFSVLNQK